MPDLVEYWYASLGAAVLVGPLQPLSETALMLADPKAAEREAELEVPSAFFCISPCLGWHVRGPGSDQ